MTLTGCNYSSAAAGGFWESPGEDDDDDFDGKTPGSDSGSEAADVDAEQPPTKTNWTHFFYKSLYDLAKPTARKKWSKMQEEAKSLNNALEVQITAKTESDEVERLAKQLLNNSGMHAVLKQLGRFPSAAEIRKRNGSGIGMSSSSVSEPAATVPPPAVPSTPAQSLPPAAADPPIAEPTAPPITTPSLPPTPADAAVPMTPPRPQHAYICAGFGTSPRYFATSASNSLISPPTTPINSAGLSPDPDSPCSA